MTTTPTSITDVVANAFNTAVLTQRIPGPPVSMTPQMGVSVTMDGVFDVKALMQKLVDNGTYKQAEMDRWLAYTDGYRMTWTFDTPSITATKAGALDTVCIYSEYGKGMLCNGVTYIGIGTLKPIRWAWYASKEQKDSFVASRPINGVDDTNNWYTNSVKFDGLWTSYRWLPKEQLQVEWYPDIYRFSPLTPDNKVFKY
jgi:hypothetical protein